MGSPRDSQRNAVYLAEEQTFPKRPEWRELSAAKIFADDTFRDPIVRARFGRAARKFVRVTEGRRHAWAHEDEIRLPKCWRSRYVVLHELAHVIVARKAWHVAPHGPEWAAVYVLMVSIRMGQDAGDRLRQAFEAGGVLVNDLASVLR